MPDNPDTTATSAFSTISLHNFGDALMKRTDKFSAG